MANTSSTSSTERKTVAQYGLTRKADRSFDDTLVDFMDPYVDASEEARKSWRSFRICDPYGEIVEELDTYAVSPRLRAYVTLSVFLSMGTGTNAKRLSPMRHREMMVDNYRAAGGDLKTWRYIGVMEIVNEETVAVIAEAFKNAGSHVNHAGSVECEPKSEFYLQVIHRSPFTQGVLNLLRDYKEEMGHAKIKKVIFITVGLQLMDTFFHTRPEVHMVIELCRPGDEGYAGEGNTFILK
ncbi:hypothetical protein GGS21DRAFT_487011 [Xylaria nigripes]|nr:hypothetical protein GGS21DRAFT_487011 [Xylaria nigripes]